MSDGPLEITERIIDLHHRMQGRKWCPYMRADAYGRTYTVAHRLFQAAEWRRYAATFDGIRIDRGFVGWPHGHRVIIDQRWVEGILGVSKADCLRRARAQHYMIRRLKRESAA